MRFKWLLIFLAIVTLLFFFVLAPYMKEQTKSHSPEVTNTYQKDDFNLSVTFSSPAKNGRVIFGELVPYDQVWRTGANEPTIFTTESTIRIADKSLPAGTYSLWTIPRKDNWEVIFNSEIPDWGVTVLSGGKKTTRAENADVIQLQVPVEKLDRIQENFLIDFEYHGELFLFLTWDNTKIKVPINQ